MSTAGRGSVRVIGWLAGTLASVVAILLLALSVYLLFFDYPQHLREWVEYRATEILDRPVKIREIYVDLPISFRLGGLSVDSSEPGTPWLELESLYGALDLSQLFQRQVRLGELRLDGLKVRVLDFGGGKVDLPGLAGAKRETPVLVPQTSWAAFANRIVVSNAEFVYDNRSIPWRLDATGLEVRLDRQEDRYRGRIEYQRGDLTIKERQPVTGSLEAAFDLTGAMLVLSELRGRGDFYDIESRGEVVFKGQPQAVLSLDVTSRVGPAARALLGLTFLQDEGTQRSTFRGTLSIGKGWHLLRGNLALPRARLGGVPLVDWRAELYWDRSGFQVVAAEGRLAGGPSRLSLRQSLPVSRNPTVLSATFDEVPLESVVESLVGRPSPLSSRVSGRIQVEFPADQALRASGDFEAQGLPGESTESSVPLSFSVAGRLDRGQVELTSSRFETPFLQAGMTGAYPWEGPGMMELDLEIQNLAQAERLQSALRAILLPPEGPRNDLALGGRGRAKGVLTGRLPQWMFQGTFAGTEFGILGAHLGRVEAQGSLSAGQVLLESVRARDGETELEGRGELRFGPGPSQWRFAGRWRGWPAEPLAEMVGLPVRPTGRVSGRADVYSKEGSLGGDASLVVVDGSLSGYPFERAEVRLTMNGNLIDLRPVSVAHGNSRLIGHLSVDVANQRIAGQIEAHGLALEKWAGRPFPVDAEVDAVAEVGGNLTEPEIDLRAKTPMLRVLGTPVGQADLEVGFRRGEIETRIRAGGEPNRLVAKVRTHPGSGLPSSGDVEWREIDVGPFLRALISDVPESVRFVTSGQASFDGPLAQPESLSVDARLSDLLVEVGPYRLSSARPLAARLKDARLVLDDLELTGDRTRVSLKGALPTRDGYLDVELSGSVNLGLLEGLAPSVASTGVVEVAAHVGGTWKRPSLSGHADIRSGALRVRGFPQAFGDIEGRLLFDARTVRLLQLRAWFGGSPLTISGTMSLRGLRPDSYEVRASGRGIRLRYPEGLVSTTDAELALTGTLETPILSGRIDVQDAVWSREYELTTGILAESQARGLEILDQVGEENPLSGLQLDVQVMAPGTLRIRNSRVSVDANADLQLRGTFVRPALVGRAEAVRGEVFLLGQRYTLLSGRVDFVDPSAIKPFFDLVTEARVRSYRVELRLSGTPDRFIPELSSDPPLRTIDILRLLSGASERDILIGSEEEELAGVGVASLLTERLSQEVGRRAERLFGLDRFSIDPFLIGQFANPTARVSIGKQIYKDLSINYSTNLNSTTETLIVIEYTPRGPVSWIISRDEDGALGIDLRFRKSF